MNCLRSFGRWDRGFESHLKNGCLYVLLFCVCVVLWLGTGLATGWSVAQGVQPSVYKTLRNWRRGQGPKKGYRAFDEWMNEWNFVSKLILLHWSSIRWNMFVTFQTIQNKTIMKDKSKYKPRFKYCNGPLPLNECNGPLPLNGRLVTDVISAATAMRCDWVEAFHR
jgi:hypothetical protein